LDILENAGRNIDKALALLSEARRECRRAKGRPECLALENVVWSLLDARIRLALLKNRVRKVRERIRVVGE